MTRSTHQWSEPQRIDPQNTMRSRHEPGNDPPPWTEFEQGGRRIGEIGKTPVCG